MRTLLIICLSLCIYMAGAQELTGYKKIRLDYTGDNPATDTFIKIYNPTIQLSGQDQFILHFFESNANQFSIVRKAWAASGPRGPIVMGNVNPQVVMDANNGRVGINDLAPAEQLSVNGNTGVMGGNYLRMYNTANTGYAAVWFDGTKLRSNRPLQCDSTVYIQGNMGIGISPSSSGSDKLLVDGNIRARKIIVSQGTWSDYVFNPCYRLRDIAHLEKYIKENRHLPDLPSEKEVKQNGVDMGETQSLLLKKIEELTLYIIDLKKEMDLVKSKLKLTQP